MRWLAGLLVLMGFAATPAAANDCSPHVPPAEAARTCTEFLEKAIAAKESYLPFTYAAHMQVMLRNGMTDKALADYAKLVELLKDPAVQKLQNLSASTKWLPSLAGQAYIQKGDPDGAIAVIDADKTTDDYMRSVNAGVKSFALLQKGDIDGAIAQMDLAAKTFARVQAFPILATIFRTLKAEPARGVLYCDMEYSGAGCGQVELAKNNIPGVMEAMARGISDDYLNRNSRTYDYLFAAAPLLRGDDTLPPTWTACTAPKVEGKAAACTKALEDNTKLDSVRRYTALYNRIKAHVLSNNVDAAVAEIDPMLRLMKDGFASSGSGSDPRVLIAAAHIRSGQPDKALAVADAVKADGAFRAQSVRIQRSLAQLAKADADRAVTELGPNDPFDMTQKDDRDALRVLFLLWKTPADAVAKCVEYGFPAAMCGDAEVKRGDTPAAMKKMARGLNEFFLGTPKKEIVIQ